MAEELNEQERRETELWQVLDWSLWGNGLGDVLREAIADKAVAAISDEERETAERCIKAWHERRGPSTPVGVGTELAKRAAYLEARVGELNTRLGDLRAEHVKAGESWDRQRTRLLDDLEHMENENDQLRREVGRLRREVEFEAKSDPNLHVNFGFAAKRPCACVTDKQAAVIEAGGLSRPQCAVHPDGDE